MEVDLKLSSIEDFLGFEAYPEEFKFFNIQVEISQVFLSLNLTNIDTDLHFGNIKASFSKANAGLGIDASLGSM